MKKSNTVLILFGVVFFTISVGLFFLGLIMIVAGGDFQKRGDIAVIKLEGEIVDSLGFVEQLEDVAEREDIKAVVVRIDSPGGLVSPSQEMYRAIKRLRKEKPVVASMGTLAASGAYYVAIAADKILANEGTITGSIGVKINHVSVGELLGLAKLKPEVLATGPNKDMGSPFRPLSDNDKKLFNDMIFQMFAQFKKVVAEQRKLPAAEVDKIADGRVYTGEEALKLGLVDALGSMQDAVDEAAKLGGVEGKPEVVFPRKKGDHWMRYFAEEMFAVIQTLNLSAQREPMALWRI